MEGQRGFSAPACLGRCEPPCASCAAVRGVTERLSAGTELRSGLCLRCGVPFVVAADSASVSCVVCGHTAPLAGRLTAAQSVESVSTHAGSIDALRYDPLRRPEREPELADLNDDDPASVRWLHGAFLAVRGELESVGATERGYRRPGADARMSPEEELSLWIALRLLHMLGRGNEWLLARPFLEEIVDHARDVGQRQLAFAGLSRVAEACGDLGAARAWLDHCATRSPWTALDAAVRERSTWLALHSGDWTRVGELTNDYEFIPVAWRERLRLDLARVALEEHRGEIDRAVRSLRAALDTHVTDDVLETLAAEPVLEPCKRVYQRIQDQHRRAAMRPVRAALLFGAVAFVAGTLTLFFSRSVVMDCTRSAPHAADCTLREDLLGLELGVRVVRDVRAAVKMRSGKSDRFALESPSGRDMPDSSAHGDTETRIAIMNGFLADPKRPALTMVWDHELGLLAGATLLLAGLLSAAYAALAWARIGAASR